MKFLESGHAGKKSQIEINQSTWSIFVFLKPNRRMDDCKNEVSNLVSSVL